jgi:hypothetical protein
MASPVVFFRNVALGTPDTGGRTSTVGEPSLATSDLHVFFTGNWYASRSSDNGATWQPVDPFTTLPPPPGGFCCDQTSIFVPGRNLTIWLLQYSQAGNTNTLRIAANPGPGLNTANWRFWDLRPVDVDPNWSGEWFDYNHAALSNGFLYVGTNAFTVAEDTFTRSVVFRIPLDVLSSDGPLTFDYFESTDNFSLRCAQGATDTMYIVSHNDLSQIRVFSWPESGTQVTATDVDVSPWVAGNYSAPGPDGRNWMSRCDQRITGVWVAQGQIGVMWSANRRAPDRPMPYVRVVRLDEATKAVVAEPDIWNAQTAFAYPDAYPSGSGEVGICVFRGGGPNFPGHAVGFWESAAGAWRLRISRNGTDGPIDGKWGDYLTCRRHSPTTETWVAAGFTLQGGGERSNIQPRYVHFGRRPTP